MDTDIQEPFVELATPQPYSSLYVEEVERADHRYWWLLRFLCGLAVVCGLFLFLMIGARREAHRKASGRLPVPKLAFGYGDPIPEFRASGANGHSWTNADLRGKWTLMVIVDPSCRPCVAELRALSQSRPSFGQKVRPLVVVEGESGSDATAFMRRSGFDLEAVGDPDKSLGRKFRTDAFGTPFSVITDPGGIIRLISVSHVPSGPNSSVLADACVAFATGASAKPLPLALTQWKRFATSPDVPVMLSDGQRTSLHKLSTEQPLVITFLPGTDPIREQARVSSMAVFTRSPTMRFLLVRSPVAEPAIQPPGNWLVGHQHNERLFKEYEVTRGPVTAILYKGRVLVGEEVPLESDQPMLQALSYTTFLSASATLLRGIIPEDQRR